VMANTTGSAFSTVIDDTDQFIYVSSEPGSASAKPAANTIRALKVTEDVVLAERSSSTILPISGVTGAQGVAVFQSK
jgi:hypothetical protein